MNMNMEQNKHYLRSYPCYPLSVLNLNSSGYHGWISIYRNVKKDHKPCTGVLTLAPVLDSVMLTLKQCDASKYLSPAVKTRLAALCCVH